MNKKKIEDDIWTKIDNIKTINIRETDPYGNLKTIIDEKSNSDFELMIEIKNLTHKFKNINVAKSKIVYNDISFNIYKGQKIAFLGPNGAGKTLMVETICGTRKSSSGEIIYHFKHEFNNPYEKLGIQFQDFEFPVGLTVKDILQFVIKLNNITNIEVDEFNYILETFQLKKILNHKVSKLSGGQKQRLNVTMALLNKPKVLFLDEFTTGLDIAIKNDIQKFIITYCEKNNTSLVLISHDIDSIKKMVDRIIIIADKQIKIDLSLSEIEEKFDGVSKLLKKYIIY